MPQHNENHKNVSKLYDLCVKNLIKNSLELIIRGGLNVKLPATVCDSIFAEYLIYYENKVRIFERNEYFMLNQLMRQYKKQEATLNELNEQIECFINDNKNRINNRISSYDLLKCFSNELSLSTVIYKQCLRTHTPLHERLKKLIKTLKSPILTQNLVEHVNKILNLRNVNNPKHLNDDDLELLCKNKIEYLDICPCLLTNRVIFMINSSLKSLKYLKLQNYCDWSQQQQNGEEYGRLFRNSLIIKEEEMIDEDEEDDDDDDDELIEQSTDNIEINENIDYIDDDEEISSSDDDEDDDDDQEEKTYTKLLNLLKNNPMMDPSNIQEIIKNLIKRNSNFLPLWMSKHIHNSTTSNVASTAAAAAASTSQNNEEYENLDDFFLNEQKSTCMNEEQVAKYLINLQLLAKQEHHSSISQSKLNIEQFSILNLENLQYLSLKSLDNCLQVSVLNDILSKFKQLKYLDLTSCFKSSTENNHLTPKKNLIDSLKHLIFSNFNPDELASNLNFIISLKNINYLDVSNYREKNQLNTYRNPSCLLAKIVFYLKNLQSLDISGTNLGGPEMFKLEEEIEYIKRKLEQEMLNFDDFSQEEFKRERLEFLKNISHKNCNESKISGLLFLNSKLSFFGCLNCDQNVSARERIPASHIASESKEEYLFTCLEVYLDKSLFILDTLNHLFELYRDGMIVEKQHGGHLIMNCMQKYLNHSRIQISGSASLFYVLKYSKEENKTFTPFYIKRLVEIIINAMEEHIDENAMRRNCVLIMCRLSLPDDVLHVSDRLIHIILKIFDDFIEEQQKLIASRLEGNSIVNNNNHNPRSDDFMIKTAMHLLNILACSVHGADKITVGSLAIPVAMELIKTKIQSIKSDASNRSDDVLEITWSFLWNITDETPENCQIFLDRCDGMSVFMSCIMFNKTEIIRNMMGLLGNVAEVKHLRDRLVKNEYIKTFRELLFKNNDGIEIPYNSAGVLAHIMSDGVDVWSKCNLHARDDVIKDLKNVIDKWDINSERNINYRSFEPIFRLVTLYSQPISQLWSVWALANLTSVYRKFFFSGQECFI
jgi:Zyg-11 protein homolog